jgi:hypothetical protein
LQALCLTVLLGGAHGLILLPVTLSILGGKQNKPPRHSSSVEELPPAIAADELPPAKQTKRTA